MKTKSLLVLVLMLTVLAACAPAPTASPVSACPTATADTKLLTNAQDGYCLLYPATNSADLPGFIVINPITSPGDMPGEAWVNIQVQDAAGRSASQAAEEAITAAGPGFNITREEVPVDGGQAVVVDGLPGLDSNRMVFLASNDRLYTLTFLPWRPSGNGQNTPLEELYQTILSSIHFLTPGEAQP